MSRGEQLKLEKGLCRLVWAVLIAIAIDIVLRVLSFSSIARAHRLIK